jgi:hypothetical protein
MATPNHWAIRLSGGDLGHLEDAGTNGFLWKCTQTHQHDPYF